MNHYTSFSKITCIKQHIKWNTYSDFRFNKLIMEDLQWLLLAPFVAMIIILLVLHGFPAKDLLPYTNQSKSNWQGTIFPFPLRSPSFDHPVVFVAVASLVQFFHYVLTLCDVHVWMIGTMFKIYYKTISYSKTVLQ